VHERLWAGPQAPQNACGYRALTPCRDAVCATRRREWVATSWELVEPRGARADRIAPLAQRQFKLPGGQGQTPFEVCKAVDKWLARWRVAGWPHRRVR